MLHKWLKMLLQCCTKCEATRQRGVCTDLVSDVDIGPSGQQQVDQILVLVLDGPGDGSPSPIILHRHKL